MLLVSALLLLAAPAEPEALFTKVRSDGVKLLCARWAKPPTIVSAKTQCNTVAGWRRRARDGRMFDHPVGLEYLTTSRLAR